MNSNSRPSFPRSWIDLPLRYVLILGALFACMMYWIDTALMYHLYVIRAFRSPWATLDAGMLDHVFSTVPLSMREEPLAAWFVRPGGPIGLAAAWISEYFFIGWVGAVAVTVATALVCLAMGELLAAVGRRRNHPLVFVPVVLVLAMAAQYVNPLPMALAVLVALAAAAAYLRLAGRSALVSAVAFLALSLVVFYLAGKAYLVLALVAAAWELNRAGRRVIALLWFLAGVLVPAAGAHLWPEAAHPSWVGRWLPFLAAENGRLTFTLPMGQWTTVPMAIGFVATGLAAVALTSLRRAERLRPLASVVLVLLLAVGAFLAWRLHNPVQPAAARMSLLAESGQWDRLLDEARAFPEPWYAAPLRHEVLRALYHTGRLGDDLFLYPQDMEGLAFKMQRDARKDCAAMAWSYLELGRLNEAEFLAQNSIETYDDRPGVLKLLAVVNVAKGHGEGAKIFLRRLRRYRAYRDEADAMLAALDKDPLLTADPYVTHLRSVAFPSDAVKAHSRIGDRWEDLVLANPRNRMAVEYLFTWWLLSRQVPEIVNHLSYLDVIDRPMLPRRWQEAILLYHAIEKRPVALGRWGIGPEVVACYTDFLQQWEAARRAADPEAAMAGLTDRFGHTYFYYYFFGPGAGER